MSSFNKKAPTDRKLDTKSHSATGYNTFWGNRSSIHTFPEVFVPIFAVIVCRPVAFNAQCNQVQLIAIGFLIIDVVDVLCFI
ncbi:hypothetical protein LCGC14_2941360, partial [marine sediment metagenome]